MIRRGWPPFFVREGPLDRTLTHFFSRFDLIVLFGKDAEGPLISNLRKVCPGRVLHIHSFPNWDEGIHLTDHLLKQLARYGIPFSETHPKLYLTEADREWGEKILDGKGNNL